MLELPMTAPLVNLMPAMGFEHRDHLMNLPGHMTVSAAGPRTGRRGRQASALAWRTGTSMSDAWVYILRCADGSLYTGWSTDVARRLQRHNAGTASRYTASRLPVELVYEAALDGRSAAMREEVRIKALDRRQKLALIADRRRRQPVRRGRVRS